MNLRTSNIDKLRLGRSGEEMPRTRTVCIGCIMIVGEVAPWHPDLLSTWPVDGLCLL